MFYCAQFQPNTIHSFLLGNSLNAVLKTRFFTRSGLEDSTGNNTVSKQMQVQYNVGLQNAVVSFHFPTVGVQRCTAL